MESEVQQRVKTFESIRLHTIKSSAYCSRCYNILNVLSCVFFCSSLSLQSNNGECKHQAIITAIKKLTKRSLKKNLNGKKGNIQPVIGTASKTY